MSLLHTPVVPPVLDAFWELPAGLPDAPRRIGLLVVAAPFGTGSAEETTLLNLCKACRLSPEQYHLLQLGEDEPAAWHRLRDALFPATVLLLGISPAQLGVSALLRFNECNRFDGAVWIPTLSLPELNVRKDVKQALWTGALKPCFPEA